MKCILTVLVSITILSLHTFAHNGLRPRGDLNCDWEVNIADANVLADAIIAKVPYHSLYTYAHDINADKVINIADLNMLIGAILGDELSPMPTYSGTLPVLFINTEGHQNIVSKEEYMQAEWWLDNMGIDNVVPIGSAASPLGMKIKGHGNASWKQQEKKPFRLKLNEKQPLLGMPSNRNWVLLANANYWKGMINDVLPWELGRRMGMAWNPHFEPVEVVLNGQYIGLYFLTEKIRVGKKRVNITEQQDGETVPYNMTGGWLLEIDNYATPNRITIVDQNSNIMITPHSPDELSAEQRAYITDFLVKTNEAIKSNNVNDRTWELYIDIDALAIYYIIQEITDNIESFSGSCYMYKERGNNTKLIFGPLWDGGCVYHRWSPTYKFNEFIYENVPSFSHLHWITEIVKFKHFQERVHYYWKKFYQGVYPGMDDFLDRFAARIDEAGNYDSKIWPTIGSDNISQRMEQYGKPSFHKKVAWLQSQWGR